MTVTCSVIIKTLYPNEAINVRCFSLAGIGKGDGGDLRKWWRGRRNDAGRRKLGGTIRITSKKARGPTHPRMGNPLLPVSACSHHFHSLRVLLPECSRAASLGPSSERRRGSIVQLRAAAINSASGREDKEFVVTFSRDRGGASRVASIGCPIS